MSGANTGGAAAGSRYADQRPYVVAAYRAEGFGVDIDLRLDTLARLHVTDPAHPDQQHRVELVVNWRAEPGR